MRALIVLWVLLSGINAAAQIKSAQKASVSYIGSSSNGSSDAVIVDNVPLVHTKQFLPVDKNGTIKGNLRSQLDQVFENISESLNKSGSDSDQIIKVNVFLTGVNLISDVQAMISQKFEESRKPAVMYAIGELTHPDALISVDVIAISKSNVDHVKYASIRRETSAAILPAGPVVYVSGQAAKGELSEATKATLLQLKETLSSLGLSLKDIVQIKSFLTPMSSLHIVKKQFNDFFEGETVPPLVFVDWISADPVIEIELIASSREEIVKNLQVEYLTPPGMISSPVYSKVSKLNYGKKVYLSGLSGFNSMTPDAEVNSLFVRMGNILKASNSGFNNLLKATYYVSNDQISRSLGDLRPKFYDPKRPPAASKAMLKGIGLNGAGISIDMIGTIKE
ncbi:MAG: RidA family protein [Bacteroidota bacterium]